MARIINVKNPGYLESLVSNQLLLGATLSDTVVTLEKFKFVNIISG